MPACAAVRGVTDLVAAAAFGRAVAGTDASVPGVAPIGVPRVRTPGAGIGLRITRRVDRPFVRERRVGTRTFDGRLGRLHSGVGRAASPCAGRG